MKTLIICHSEHHGNTQKIAQAIANELGADIKEPYEVSSETIQEYDLIGFGSGIYAGKHHDSLFAVVQRLPNVSKNTFIFSTRAIHALLFYHKLLRRKLTDKNYLVIKEFSCPGFATYGPLKLVGGVNKGRPNAQDLANARQFASLLKQSIQS